MLAVAALAASAVARPIRPALVRRTASPLLQFTQDETCLLPEVEDASPAEGDDALGGVTVGTSTFGFDAALVAIPFVVPALAFGGFDLITDGFNAFLEVAYRNNWAPADGGASRATYIIPILTGICLPAVSFALGTLTATTVSNLRTRQISIRSSLNAEACTIRSTHSAVDSLFPAGEYDDDRRKAVLLLRQYCSRVLVESRAGINLDQLDKLGAANSELDGLTSLLHHCAASKKEADAAAAAAAGSYDRYHGRPRFEAATEFLAMMYLKELQHQRSDRLATLQTTFPAIHWVVLTLLGLSILVGFLIAADQDVLRFLAPLQLRILFTVLVGALSSTATLCADLADPFRGAFRVTPSSEQIILVRSLIDQSLCGPDAEQRPSAAVDAAAARLRSG